MYSRDVHADAVRAIGPLISGIVCLLLLATPAASQTVDRPFEDLGRYLDIGDTVFVVSRESEEARGTLARLSPTSIVVQIDGQEREFVSNDVGWLETFPDPVWDQAWQGALAGYLGTLGGGYFLCRSFGGERGDCGTFLADGDLHRIAAAGAGLIAAIAFVDDAVRRERWLVYGTRPGEARRQLRAPTPVGSLGDLWSRVRPGDTVHVRDAVGAEVTGTLTSASTSGLTLMVDGTRREMSAGDVRQVWRRTGLLGRTMLVGLAGGAVLGALAKPEYGTRRSSAFAGATVGLSLGYLVGPLLPGRTLVYGGPSGSTVVLRPLLGPRGAGIALSARF